MKLWSEEEFKGGFQIFLLFLISQFFGPVFSLIGILPFNISLVWSPLSAIFSSCVVMLLLGYKKHEKIIASVTYGWILIISLNVMSYIILGLILSPTAFVYLAVCMYLYMLAGMYFGKAIRPYVKI